MSWLFSQALVEEYLEANYSDGELSAPLSGSHTQLAYLPPDRMTAFSRLSRFGMTFKPLTADRGEELLTLYLEDFHAKTSQLQETVTDLTESEAECGEKWHGLLARFDQDTHLWRTVQCSLLEDLNESLQTLPQWGMTIGGELYLLPTLAQTIGETEFGLSEKWPTPRSCSAMAATITPESAWNEKRNPNLETIVGRRIWGTPKAQYSRHALRDRGKGNLGEQVAGLHNGGKLNPMWVEWLMGWPLGWTDLKPLETDKFQRWLDAHGKS